MKRFLVITGVILGVVVVFGALIKLKTDASKPEVILAAIKRGKGNVEELKMRLSIARGDTVPLVIEAYQDTSAEVSFRADMLDILFKKYHRSGDDRILEILLQALKSPALPIRRVAITGFAIYSSNKQLVYLIDAIQDPDADIRRTVLVAFSTRGTWWEEALWPEFTKEERNTIVEKAGAVMQSEPDDDIRFLARAVVGREISYLCQKAREGFGTADYDKGERLLGRALELDPKNHQARITLVRQYLDAGMKKKALELAQEYGAVLRIPRLPSAPAIDGDPRDPVWQHAFRYVDKPFYHTTSRWAPKEVEGRSGFYIGHHDGTIYIAVLGYEEDLTRLKIKHKTRDSSVWRDDCVELFFDPGADSSEVRQFVINPIGTVFDSIQEDGSENMIFQIQSTIRPDLGCWVCEFAAAAEELGEDKLSGETIWGINIIRARIGAASEHCAYWPAFGYAHNYDRYPIAVFDGFDRPVELPSEETPATRKP